VVSFDRCERRFLFARTGLSKSKPEGTPENPDAATHFSSPLAKLRRSAAGNLANPTRMPA